MSVISSASPLAKLQAIGATLDNQLGQCSGPVGIERLVRHIVDAGKGAELLPLTDYILNSTMGKVDQPRIVANLLRVPELTDALKPRLPEIFDQPDLASFVNYAPSSFLAWDTDFRDIAKAVRDGHDPQIKKMVSTRMPKVLMHIADKGFAGNYAAMVSTWYGDDKKGLTGDFNQIAPSLSMLLNKPMMPFPTNPKDARVDVSAPSFVHLINTVNSNPTRYNLLEPISRPYAGTIIEDQTPIMACTRGGNALATWTPTPNSPTLGWRSDATNSFTDHQFGWGNSNYGGPDNIGAHARALFMQLSRRNLGEGKSVANRAVHQLRRYGTVSTLKR